jgi:hypothetical protein
VNVLRRWSSSTSVATSGFELISAPLAAADVAAALRPLRARDVAGGAFLLVRLGTTDHHGVEVAVESAQELGLIRICLAIDQATLERVDCRLLGAKHVGLLLDDVDAETPLSAFVRDAIEAVRFRDAFVGCASGRLRLDAALRAMLGLAHDLGLGTLGPASSQTGDPTAAQMFDYVASSIDASRVGLRSAR